MSQKNLILNIIGAVLLVIALAAAIYLLSETSISLNDQAAAVITFNEAAAQTPLSRAWLYNFDSAGTLYEAASPDKSSSPYWWLNSGAMMILEGGVGRTVHKALPLTNPWLLTYRLNNLLDTDGGRYPQNLFRLVSKLSVGDSDITVNYRVLAVNMTDTPNRDGYSGIFLFSRYQDGDNLYYAGVRHDGDVVIKKKIGGIYHTLGQVEHFPSYRDYERYTNPNLIPGQVWQRLRLVTKTEGDSIRLTFYVADSVRSSWEEVLSVVDDGVGGKPHHDAGRFGLRTDFMDVQFDNYRVDPL